LKQEIPESILQKEEVAMKYFSILLLVLLSGCASFEKPEAEFSCPVTGFIRDAEMVSYFRDSVIAAAPVTAVKKTKKSNKNKVKTSVAPIAPVAAAVAPPALFPASDLLLRAEMNGFQGDCSLDGKGNIIVQLKLPITVHKGAAGQGLQKKLLPYFIALVSPEEEIIQRQSFAAKADLEGAQSVAITEENTITLPPQDKTQKGQYKILIGFQMTPQQLKYNQIQNQQPQGTVK
jgi:hypothetical protein